MSEMESIYIGSSEVYFYSKGLNLKKEMSVNLGKQ